MTIDHVIAIATVVGVIVASAAVVVTLKGLRDQLWLQTFSEYTRRYGEIVNTLPSEARRPGGNFKFEALEPDEQGQILNIARAYLNLCSEEFFLHKRGRIDDQTWKIWREGMIHVLEAPWIQSTWKVLQPEYKFGEFCVFIDECIRAAGRRVDASSASYAPTA